MLEDRKRVEKPHDIHEYITQLRDALSSFVSIMGTPVASPILKENLLLQWAVQDGVKILGLEQPKITLDEVNLSLKEVELAEKVGLFPLERRPQ